MKNVLFVGDGPSKENVSEKIAFVGAKCFSTLIEWIKFIQPDYYICCNSINSADECVILNLNFSGQFKFIALGNNASKRLNELNVKHFKLPHPSGRNRKLNDKNFIKPELKKAKDYINGDFVC